MMSSATIYISCEYCGNFGTIQLLLPCSTNVSLRLSLFGALTFLVLEGNLLEWAMAQEQRRTLIPCETGAWFINGVSVPIPSRIPHCPTINIL